MNYIDFILFGLLILGFILGYKDGLIRKMIGLIGIIAGLFMAVKCSRLAGKLLAPLFDHETYFSELASGVIIFVICIIIASVIKRVVHPHDKVNQLANQLLGGLTGTVQVAFYISCFLLLTGIFNFPNKKTASESLLYNYVYGIVPKTVDLVIGDKTFVKDYIESRDSNSKRLSDFDKKDTVKDKSAVKIPAQKSLIEKKKTTAKAVTPAKKNNAIKKTAVKKNTAKKKTDKKTIAK